MRRRFAGGAPQRPTSPLAALGRSRRGSVYAAARRVRAGGAAALAAQQADGSTGVGGGAGGAGVGGDAGGAAGGERARSAARGGGALVAEAALCTAARREREKRAVVLCVRSALASRRWRTQRRPSKTIRRLCRRFSGRRSAALRRHRRRPEGRRAPAFEAGLGRGAAPLQRTTPHQHHHELERSLRRRHCSDHVTFAPAFVPAPEMRTASRGARITAARDAARRFDPCTGSAPALLQAAHPHRRLNATSRARWPGSPPCPARPRARKRVAARARRARLATRTALAHAKHREESKKRPQRLRPWIPCTPSPRASKRKSMLLLRTHEPS